MSSPCAKSAKKSIEPLKTWQVQSTQEAVKQKLGEANAKYKLAVDRYHRKQVFATGD